MRLIPRHRHHRTKLSRISISQEEILADLLYPASRRPRSKSLVTRVREVDR
jgi:hypothetical protein